MAGCSRSQRATTEYSASNSAGRRAGRTVRHIPNIISVIRILLVVPIAFALAYGQQQTAIALFALAAVSDAADGFLARRFGWQSELGGILDPIADKLLLATVFV